MKNKEWRINARARLIKLKDKYLLSRNLHKTGPETQHNNESIMTHCWKLNCYKILSATKMETIEILEDEKREKWQFLLR